MSKKFKLGVLGDPIEHSLSPFIHSRFSRNENINLEYLPYRVEEANFDKFIKDFFSDKLAKGLNITLPHKKRAAKIEGNIEGEFKGLSEGDSVAKMETKNGEMKDLLISYENNEITLYT